MALDELLGAELANATYSATTGTTGTTSVIAVRLTGWIETRSRGGGRPGGSR